MVEIRQLRYSSWPIVDMLNRLLRQLSDDPQEITEGALEGILRSDSRVYVAIDDGWIVGTATLVPVQLISGTKCWIEDVVVDEHYRGSGLGRQLMEYAINDAPLYAASINLTSSRHREAARNLYRSLGFEEREDSGLYRLRRF